MFTDIDHAVRWLERRRHKTTLEAYRDIMQTSGLDFQSLKMIHVAGTNGKGSTVHDIACILQAAGLCVGTFTSPYLIKHQDRICLNGTPIPDDIFLDLINTWQPFIEANHLSMFESDLLLMLAYYLEVMPDVVIVEAGIGGRFDKTNLIMPLASVITNIGHDHLVTLGPTLADVAWQKGGIIKPGVPVFVGEMALPLGDNLSQIAKELHAPITFSHPPQVSTYPIRFGYRGLDIELGDVGFYQVKNACLAIDVIMGLYGHQMDKAIVQGLKQAHWPGRFEHFAYGKRDIYIDGAHNLEAIDALIETIHERVKDQKVDVVYAALKDKDYLGMANRLCQAGFQVSVCGFNDERALTAKDISRLAGLTYVSDMTEALARWKKSGDPLLVFTGSLHFISAIRHLLMADPEIKVFS